MIRSMCRYIARLGMEKKGIKKPVKKGFFALHWKEYAPKRRKQ